MSEGNVTAFPGAQIESDRRAEFARHAATSFDRYVKDYGVEPDCIVMVLGGVKQGARCSWLMQGDSRGGSTTMLSFAQAVLMKEIVNPDDSSE